MRRCKKTICEEIGRTRTQAADVLMGVLGFGFWGFGFLGRGGKYEGILGVIIIVVRVIRVMIGC